MKKVTYKPLLTTSLSIRAISSFQLNRLYIWNISGSSFYLIVLTCKNTTCKLESKSKEIQLYVFKIDLKFSTSSLKIMKSEHLRKMILILLLSGWYTAGLFIFLKQSLIFPLYCLFNAIVGEILVGTSELWEKDCQNRYKDIFRDNLEQWIL